MPRKDGVKTRGSLRHSGMLCFLSCYYNAFAAIDVRFCNINSHTNLYRFINSDIVQKILVVLLLLDVCILFVELGKCMCIDYA